MLIRASTRLRAPWFSIGLVAVFGGCSVSSGGADRLGTGTDPSGVSPSADAGGDADSGDGVDASSVPDDPSGADASVRDAAVASGPSFPAVTDFAARGPFETLNEASAADCTVFRPKMLGEGALLHPVIIWGNGTLGFPAVYAGVLDHWASHGFIVAAANTSNAGSGVEMVACLDWVISESKRAGSPYERHVDESHAGATGHSQGGGGALMVGRDARVTVTAPLMAYTQGLGHDLASEAQQQGPMLLLSGSADTIAPPDQNQRPVFETSNVPTFWATLEGADHIGMGLGDLGNFRAPATAWFRLHLMHDESARGLFYGANCALCSDAKWVVQRKDID